MNKKYQISKSFFSDKDQELIDELAKYEEFISKKRNAALEEENTPSQPMSLRHYHPSPLNDFDTIAEVTEENKSFSDSIYNQPENPFISRSKFKSNRKNLFFENSEQFKDKSEASPEFDANRLTAWLEKSEKKLDSHQFSSRPQHHEESKALRSASRQKKLSESYELEEIEESKESYTEFERKKLFTTPSGKNESMSYGYEAGEDTHEKVKHLLEHE